MLTRLVAMQEKHVSIGKARQCEQSDWDIGKGNEIYIFIYYDMPLYRPKRDPCVRTLRKKLEVNGRRCANDCSVIKCRVKWVHVGWTVKAIQTIAVLKRVCVCVYCALNDKDENFWEIFPFKSKKGSAWVDWWMEVGQWSCGGGRVRRVCCKDIWIDLELGSNGDCSSLRIHTAFTENRSHGLCDNTIYSYYYFC